MYTELQRVRVLWDTLVKSMGAIGRSAVAMLPGASSRAYSLALRLAGTAATPFWVLHCAGARRQAGISREQCCGVGPALA